MGDVIDELMERLRAEGKDSRALYEDKYIIALYELRTDLLRYRPVTKEIAKIMSVDASTVREHIEIRAAKIKAKESTDTTVIDAIKTLASVCDGATSRDGAGFNKRDNKERIIKKAISESNLSPEEEKIALKILKKYKRQLKGLGVDYDAIVPIARSKSAEDSIEESEFSKRVKAAARDIIDRGETYEYIYKVWQSRVKGNSTLGQALAVSRGVQSCLNTKGLHVFAHGRHGQGKSHGNDIMVDLMPSNLVKDGNISPKVLYYMSQAGLMLPGTTIHPDDLNLSNPLADLFKKVTTRFQKGAEHRVVIDGEVFELKLPPRTSIWTSAVNLQGDEQFRDRFLDIQIDENQTEGIIEFMKQKDSECHNADQYDFETAVCQELFRDLADRTFTVKIPFANRIKFPESENTRGYGIFSDLIKGLCALRYTKRKTDENGYLLADLDDFRDAKTLYEALAGHSEQKYTSSERMVLQAIIDLNYSATIGQLHEMTGKSPTYLRDIFNGRGNGEQQRRGGLLAKCSALKVESETITETFTDPVDGRKKEKSKTRNVYTLDRSFRLMENGSELITLNDEVNVDQRSHAVEVNVKTINSSSEVNVDNVLIKKMSGVCDDSTSDLLRGHICARTIKTYVDYVNRSPDSESHYVDPTLTIALTHRPIAKTHENDSSSEVNVIAPESCSARWEDHLRSKDLPSLVAFSKTNGESKEFADLQLNIYSRCSHGCSYCYNGEKFNSWQTDIFAKASLENIEHDLRLLAEMGDRTRIHMTFIADPYDCGRADNSYVREVLKLFRKYNHPFQILTKGGTKAVGDFDLYGPDDWFGCTLTSDNEADSKTWEPNAALPADRIEALRIAHERGIKTWVSLEPVIDIKQTLHLVELTHEFVDHYGIGKLNHDHEKEAAIDWYEFLCAVEARLIEYGKSYRIKKALLDAADKPKAPSSSPRSAMKCEGAGDARA